MTISRVAAAVAIIASAGMPRAEAQWERYTRAFDAFAAADSVVGGCVLLMRDGRVLSHHEYGLADRDRREPMTDQTIVHWASITKTLTAIAIMQLRDRGKLSLGDPVTRWVPELRQVHDPYGSMDDVTIRMLLSHSSGFQNPTWPYTSGRSWEPFEPTRWEQLASMMPYQQLLFAPGSRFGYSNPAFIYLARIIEQLTGDPYGIYIQKNIWTPLGLSRSYFGATPYHLARWRSNNYTLKADSTGRERVTANGRDFDPGITIPNSGWNAPLSDLATYVAFSPGPRMEMRRPPAGTTPCSPAVRSRRCGGRSCRWIPWRGSVQPWGSPSSSFPGMAVPRSSGTPASRPGSGHSSISIRGPQGR
jgi:CubicO group peptidase (beta-lactamase class C family)